MKTEASENQRRESERRFWERSASRYDAFVFRFGSAYTRMLDWIDSRVDPAPSMLEVACGTGNISLRLCRKAGSYVALDISPKMIEQGRRKASTQGIENVRFEIGDGYSLPFPDSTFAVVVCANALHVVEEPGRVLSELDRVLQPGGKLIAPNYLHGQSRLVRILSYALRVVGFRARHRFSEESYGRLFAGSGLADIRLTLLSDPVPIACVEASKPRKEKR